MPTPRSHQVILSETPYYHCVSRCVRRAFLCGFDKLTEQSFDHRRDWVEARLLFLASVYTIDICAFAVMSNHTHIVVKIQAEKATTLRDTDVLNRWHKLHFGTLLTRKYCQTSMCDKHLLPTLNATVDVYRKRLSDLSWFMKDLNEYIARKANAEDGCSGHFWEGRYRSQALLDEAAIISCMAYVDLNPIRAQMAKELSKSDFTSIQRRIKAALNKTQPTELLPFTGGETLNKPEGITFNVQDYLALVDTTGRCVVQNKKGYISDDGVTILTKLGISDENWLEITQHFEDYFLGAAGVSASIEAFTEQTGRKRRHNYSNCAHYFQ